MEQVLRIDPKTLSQTHPTTRATSFSARSLDTNISHSTVNTILSRPHLPVSSLLLNSTNQQQQSYMESTRNEKMMREQTLPTSIFRTQANRSSASAIYEKTSFKPIEHQQSSGILDNTSSSELIHPQTTRYSMTEGINFVSRKIMKNFRNDL